jgi:hypothetical protein
MKLLKDLNVLANMERTGRFFIIRISGSLRAFIKVGSVFNVNRKKGFFSKG